MEPNIVYLPDADVDAAVDREIRGLLTTCFTGAQDTVFQHQRYFAEPYPHRWIIRDASDALVAHVGVHEKQVEAGGREYPIAGIAEVCVHPGCRGRGYLRKMFARIHPWLAGRGRVFSVLFGKPEVYSSSGYEPVGNLFHGGGEAGWTPAPGLVRRLTAAPWPAEDVRLPGPKF